MTARFDKHYQIDTALSLTSDSAMLAWLARVNLTQGWGTTGSVRLNEHELFVKKVPLTDREMSKAYSTKNLYRIPSWYSYGVGSAGFGAFRELAAQRKTTNWVLGGETSAFPLLHHYRILPITQPVLPIDDLDGYVAYWNDSQSVRRYMLDRAQSKFELVMFIENLMPFPAWIDRHPGKLPGMVQSALKNVEFMQANGMIHFDAHAQNWLTDGQQVNFTDFGLVLDESFELSSSERAFMKQHRNFDYAQVIATVGDAVGYQYLGLDKTTQKKIEKALVVAAGEGYRFFQELIRNASALHDAKLMLLPAVYRKHLGRYLSIIETKNDFFLKLRTGKKRVDQYPRRKLNRLLKATGVLS